MTIEEAINQLFESKEFKEAAKQKAYLRVLLSRYNKDELKAGAKVELLLEFGYTITAKKNVRKKRS